MVMVVVLMVVRMQLAVNRVTFILLVTYSGDDGASGNVAGGCSNALGNIAGGINSASGRLWVWWCRWQ